MPVRRTGTPPWKTSGPPTRREAMVGKLRGSASANQHSQSWRDRHPTPADLTPDEAERRRRNIRRWGIGILVLCVAIAVVATIVMLSVNRGTADLGARFG